MSQLNIIKPVEVPKKSKDKDVPMEIDEEPEFDPQNPYKDIILSQNNNDEDIICDICLESDYEDDDQIVICELCLAGVH